MGLMMSTDECSFLRAVAESPTAQDAVARWGPTTTTPKKVKRLAALVESEGRSVVEAALAAAALAVVALVATALVAALTADTAAEDAVATEVEHAADTKGTAAVRLLYSPVSTIIHGHTW